VSGFYRGTFAHLIRVLIAPGAAVQVGMQTEDQTEPVLIYRILF
jgi:hypothetical protein